MSGKTKPIPVRLNEETRARLATAADKTNLNRSDILRLSLISGLDQIDKGKIPFPNLQKKSG